MKQEKPVDGFIRMSGNEGAIINTDNDALKAYKLQKQAERAKEREINTLKEDVQQIKDLLSQLLEKIK